MQEFWRTANPGIIKYPDPVLRRLAVPVKRISPGVQHLIDRMIKVLKQAGGLGLAAPQVGVSERVVLVAPLDQPIIALVNPELVMLSDATAEGQEGCLSIPRLYGDVVRSIDVEIRGMNRKGKIVTHALTGMAARVAQHEVDHLDGILFTDKAISESLHWHAPGDDDDDEEYVE